MVLSPTAGVTKQMTVYVTNDSGASWKSSIVTPENGAIVDRPWMAYSPNGVLGLMWKAIYATRATASMSGRRSHPAAVEEASSRR